jgi:Kelch motif
MTHNLRFMTAKCLMAICALGIITQTNGLAGSWTAVTPLPGGAQPGTMILLTDGTVMMVNYAGPGWLRLTPDSSGNYAKGSWTPLAPMSQARLFFASQVLPSGKIWVLGGEYSGPGLPRTDTSTAEIYDPIANSWSTAAPYPNQPGLCGTATIPYTGSVTTGSNVITAIPSTASFYVGWTVTGAGIPANTTITSIDSISQVHISNAATATNGADALAFSGDRPACFGAVPSSLLPGGTQILAGSLVDKSTNIYNIATNTWTLGGSKVYDQSDEEGYSTTSAPGAIVVYDVNHTVDANVGSGFAERYNPVSNSWSSITPNDGSALGTLPVLSSAVLGNEFGPTLRLQDGRILEVGANSLTALYTPSTNTWAAGPAMMGTLNGNAAPFGADDAPGAILPNGHVLLAGDAGPAISDTGTTGNTTELSNIITNIPSTALFQVGWSVADADGSNTVIPQFATIASIDSPTQITISDNATVTRTGVQLRVGGTFSSPTQLFDFNPAGAGSISPLAAAYPGDLSAIGAFLTRMVVLPTGQVLFGVATTDQIYVYTPDGSASPTLRPVVSSIAYNGSGKFTLTGRQLDGQSAGADYGDDVQMDSNYPILRLVNSSGKVFYCVTSNWSAPGTVGNSTVPQTVNFRLNPAITPGNYSAIVSGGGISSFPIAVSITQAEVNGN